MPTGIILSSPCPSLSPYIHTSTFFLKFKAKEERETGKAFKTPFSVSTFHSSSCPVLSCCCLSYFMNEEMNERKIKILVGSGPTFLPSIVIWLSSHAYRTMHYVLFILRISCSCHCMSLSSLVSCALLGLGAPCPEQIEVGFGRNHTQRLCEPSDSETHGRGVHEGQRNARKKTYPDFHCSVCGR